MYRYAEDPTTSPWGFRYRFGEVGAVKEWRPGWKDPIDLLEHIANGGVVVIHNAAFERTIWNWVIVARMCPHWPLMTIQQQDCTMSRAAALAFPMALEGLGDALETNFRKDMDGHRLMMKMAKPRKIWENGTVQWWDDPDDIDRNMTYCGMDVETETNVDQILPPLSPRNRADWELDQIINERGVPINTVAVKNAADLVAYAKKQNDKIMRDITGREVPKCSTDAKIIEWLNKRGVISTSLAKGEVENVVFMATLMNDEAAQNAIKLRQAAWKTSTAKYAAMTECVNSDGRIRGLIAWHGASTGRRAGRLVQPQNFPRLDDENLELVQRVEYLHRLLSNEGFSVKYAYEMMNVSYGPLSVLDTLSKALRLMFEARKGRKFVGGDFSNIEGRVNAWLAGETWKLKAFEAYDNKTGPDLYKLAYSGSFGVAVEDVLKEQRQIGKVQELALGFQGSVGAFITMGANYGVNPFTVAPIVQAAADEFAWEMTRLEYSKLGQNHYDLFEREWTALKLIVNNWRKANSMIVAGWWELQDAAVNAVHSPGFVVSAYGGKVQYYFDGRYLWCILPSGRMLCYADAKVVTTKKRYIADDGSVRERVQYVVRFKGKDSRTGQWVEQQLYGGLQCENIVQAVAVDILVDAMFRAEEAGYPLILTVHDELLSEVDDEVFYNADNFRKIMMQKASIYEGLPINVAAWEGQRYS